MSRGPAEDHEELGMDPLATNLEVRCNTSRSIANQDRIKTRRYDFDARKIGGLPGC
jgi:hypothetical protein